MAKYDLSLKTPDWRQFQDDIVVHWNADVRSFLRDVESVKPTPKEIMDIYAPAAKGQMSLARAGDLQAMGQRLWEERIRNLVGQKNLPVSGPNLRHEDVWNELLEKFRNETGWLSFADFGESSKEIYDSVKNWEKRNPKATAEDAYNWILQNVYNPAMKKFNNKKITEQQKISPAEIKDQTKKQSKTLEDLSKENELFMKATESTTQRRKDERDRMYSEEQTQKGPAENLRGRFGFNTMFEPGGPTRMPPAWS